MVVLACRNPGSESVDALKVAICVDVDKGDDSVDSLTADDCGEGGLVHAVEVVVEVPWANESIWAAVCAHVADEDFGACVVQDFAVGDFAEERTDVAGEAGLEHVDDGGIERISLIEAAREVSHCSAAGMCGGQDLQSLHTLSHDPSLLV